MESAEKRARQRRASDAKNIAQTKPDKARDNSAAGDATAASLSGVEKRLALDTAAPKRQVPGVTRHCYQVSQNCPTTRPAMCVKRYGGIVAVIPFDQVTRC